MRNWLLTLLMVLASSASAGEPYAPYSARYEVKYNGFKVGELSQSLSSLEDGKLLFETKAWTTGITALFRPDMVVERSIWRMNVQWPQPLHYSYVHTARSEKDEELFEFDWQRGSVETRRDGKKAVTLPLEPGTLDKHLYQLVLRHDLQQGKKAIRYSVAERKKIKPYEFQVVGEEVVKTKQLGRLNCLKVRQGSSTFWVAKELDYLLVKLEKSEDGNTATTVLVERSTPSLPQR